MQRARTNHTTQQQGLGLGHPTLAFLVLRAFSSFVFQRNREKLRKSSSASSQAQAKEAREREARGAGWNTPLVVSYQAIIPTHLDLTPSFFMYLNKVHCHLYVKSGMALHVPRVMEAIAVSEGNSFLIDQRGGGDRRPWCCPASSPAPLCT